MIIVFIIGIKEPYEPDLPEITRVNFEHAKYDRVTNNNVVAGYGMVQVRDIKLVANDQQVQLPYCCYIFD